MFLEVDHTIYFQYQGRDAYLPRQYHVPIRFTTRDIRILDQHGKFLVVQSCAQSEKTIAFVEKAVEDHFHARVQSMESHREYIVVLPFYLDQHDLANKTASLTIEVKAVRVKRRKLQTFAHIVLQVVAIKHVRSSACCPSDPARSSDPEKNEDSS